MKIEELSVGDWVNIDNPLQSGAGQIVEIRSNTVLVQVPSCVVGARLKSIEPIPLTPEILEKNGWFPPRKDIGGDTWWWTNKEDKAIEAYEYDGEWYLTIIKQKEIQYRNRVGIGLKYVHQLQRAMELAGIEKEIVL